MINHFINKGIEYPIELLDEITNQIFGDYDMIIRNLNIIQYTDDELLNLNKKVLNHNYYTDILTFNYLEKPDIDGELFISFERVIDNQLKFKKRNEIIRYIIHGCLHLCGIEDSTPELKNQIHLLEDKYLNMFHVEH
jgi:rRNA maturation RNase YbeY